jgi:hypothetical protein
MFHTAYQSKSFTKVDKSSQSQAEDIEGDFFTGFRNFSSQLWNLRQDEKSKVSAIGLRMQGLRP